MNPSPKSLRHELLLAWLHLAVLWGFAFAKPLFDVLSDSPEFFVARGNTRGDIVLFAMAAVLVAPTVLVAIEALLAKLPRARRLVHLTWIAGLMAAFSLQILDDVLASPDGLLIVVSAALGVLGAVAYARTRAVPAILSVLGPAPVVFLVIFLLISPVSELVLPQDRATAAAVSVHSSTPVVWVVFDEFDSNMLLDRRGRIDRTRYPGFAALADRATWYRNATTVSDGTVFAVPAQLSGMRPHPDWLPIASDYPHNAFTLLGGDYGLDVTETATELCPENLCGERERETFGPRIRSLAHDLGVVSLHLLLPEGLDSKLPAVDQTFQNFGGGDSAPSSRGGSVSGGAGADPGVPSTFFYSRAHAFRRLLDGIEKKPSRGTLHFLHAALPHEPWQYLPSGQQYVVPSYDVPGLKEDGTWPTDPPLARQGLQRHLLQVGYVDRLVGRLLARLRSTNLFDDAMVVVTADHGVSYRPGESRRTMTRQTAGDIAGVPLLIKYPHERRGRIDDSMVRTIDILPTIADQLGVRIPWKLDGRPIREAERRPPGPVKVAIAGSDDVLTMPFADFRRLHRSGLRRMVDLFGSGDGGRGLYSTGTGGELLGHDPRAFVNASRPSARVELDNPELFADVRPTSALVPSLVIGRVIGGLAEGRPLAIAVNGRIGAVADTVRGDTGVGFQAMVPPAAFRPGPNRLAVLAIEGTEGRRRLARLGMERTTNYRLTEKDGTTVIDRGDSELRVQPGRVKGYVEQVKVDDQAVRVIGWAADVDRAHPAARIVVFDGSKLIAETRPTEIRADIVKAFKDFAIARCGFHLSTNPRGIDPDRLRVFAISGDGASELSRTGG